MDGPPATIAGQLVSGGRSGIIVGSKAIPFSEALPSTVESAVLGNFEDEAIFTVSGDVFMAWEDPRKPGTAVIEGPDGIAMALSIGGSSATLDGQMVSLQSDGVLVGNREMPLRKVFMSGSLDEAVFTDPNGVMHTASGKLGASTVILGGSLTLTLGGPAATIDGEVVSLGKNGLGFNGISVGSATTTQTARSWQGTSGSGPDNRGAGGAVATGLEGDVSGAEHVQRLGIVFSLFIPILLVLVYIF